MTPQEFINTVKKGLEDITIDFANPRPNRVYILIDPKDIRKSAKFLFTDMKTRFSIATGIDKHEGVEILYHYHSDENRIMVNIKTLVKKPDLEIDTVSDIIWGTNWIERELHEFLGVNFKDHEDLRRLLLSDDWPEGSYPYRRDFKPEPGSGQ